MRRASPSGETPGHQEKETVAFIDARGISKSFGSGSRARHVLDDVSFAVDRGEFVSIVGPMGSGKSTLLGILAGLIPREAGTVAIDGSPVRDLRRDTAFVFQSYSLLPWFSALENVRLAVGAAFPDRSRAAQRDQARAVLELVGLGNALHRRPGQLSGGMRQRVAIARAFAIEPEILLLDEPFGALDALTRETLQQELAKLCSSGRTVTTVMITNSVDEAILMSDRIVPLSHGPGATLGAPIEVALPRPRTKALLTHDREALHARAQVIEALTASFLKQAGRGRRAPAETPAPRALATVEAEP